MSAFVVHDLKNIVTQLSLMMKNAKRLHDNPEFQTGHADDGGEFAREDAPADAAVARRREAAGRAGGRRTAAHRAAHRRRSAEQRAARWSCRAVERVATRGHEERIERVLGHMVQNAFDATPADGRVWLELTRRSGQAVVVVGDTGQGMTREFVETRLFKPFSSTKGAGMGIGAFESSQYVRELGGRIDVDSEPQRGTVITVVLPLFETTPGF